MKFILTMRYIVVIFLYLITHSIFAQTIEQDTVAAKQLIKTAKSNFNKEEYKKALEKVAFLGNYEGVLHLFKQGLEIGKTSYPETLIQNMGTQKILSE